eukprot:m.475778 g.475778  ORF g.475778 m.475778 type:complete len:118 (-) comp20398_c0_seq18:2984-3337(-)
MPTCQLLGIGEITPLARQTEALSCRTSRTSQRLADVYATNDVTQRFRQVQQILLSAYKECAASHTTKLKFDIADTPLASSPSDPEPDPESKPFASPQHWAAFVVLGDGSRVQQKPTC